MEPLGMSILPGTFMDRFIYSFECRCKYSSSPGRLISAYDNDETPLEVLGGYFLDENSYEANIGYFFHSVYAPVFGQESYTQDIKAIRG